MRPDLFHLDSFPLVGNKTVSERNSSPKKKIKELLFPVDNCNDLFEILQGKLEDLENTDHIHDLDVLHNLPKCDLVLRKVYILGEYYSNKRHIEYYRQTPEILKITKLHERFHAIHHLTSEDNGAIWDEFPKVSSYYKELLAQLFTWIYINDYQKELIPVFRDLNQRQPLIYQTYKIFEYYDQQQATDLYWNIRNNYNKKTNNKILKLLSSLESYFINYVPSLQNQINDHLVNILTRICKNPSIFVSETDIHQLVMRELMKIKELDPDISLYETNCPIGNIGKVPSQKNYKTMLMHKEYGHYDLPNSRSDIVILSQSDIKTINDPIDLKCNQDWLTPDYIFEFGTEKSGNSDSVFSRHFLNDLEKVKKAKTQGYLIHLHRNYYLSTGLRKDKNEEKFDRYSKATLAIINNLKNTHNYQISNLPKIIVIKINIGGTGRTIFKEGKVRILKDPYNNPNCNFSGVADQVISMELQSLLF